MAATTVATPAIDLRAPGNFPIRLGPTILKPTASKKYTGIRYNYKPRLESPADTVSCINQASEDDRTELVLQDGTEEYTYSGLGGTGEDRYVLLCQGTGDDRSMLLERLEGSHDFNLTRTPEETDTAKLIEMYPQLTLEDDDDDDLFGEDGDKEEPADDSNPWDYRHFLGAGADRPAEEQDKPTPRNATRPSEAPARAKANTSNSRSDKQTEAPSAARNKRKAPPISKPNPKRVKAGAEPPPKPSGAAKPQTKRDVPKVKVNRQATIEVDPTEDDGELILENETPVSEQPARKTAMSLALSGQLGQGPISLHSAANSPASRMESPIPPRPAGIEEGEEFEIGGSSSPEAQGQRRPERQAVQRNHMDEDDGDDGDDGDEYRDDNSDADVEDMGFPSPEQTQPKNVVDSGGAISDDEEEDDLDKELALALAEDDDGDMPAAARPESDEESEEE